MTRKRYIKLLMGRYGWSRDMAVARARLVYEFGIPYENSFNMLKK